MKDPSNYTKIFDEIPPQMDIERMAVKEMIETNDPQKAIKKIPLTLKKILHSSLSIFFV